MDETAPDPGDTGGARNHTQLAFVRCAVRFAGSMWGTSRALLPASSCGKLRKQPAHTAADTARLQAPNAQARVHCCASDRSIRGLSLQVLTAQLLFHKPDDPQAFSVDLLSTMRDQGAKHLLDKGDVETMFGMFDITHQGSLSKQQAHRALKTVLGAEHQLVTASAEDGADTQTKLTKAQFVTYVTKGLQSAAA